jgi:hypothetical protein
MSTWSVSGIWMKHHGIVATRHLRMREMHVFSEPAGPNQGCFQ